MEKRKFFPNTILGYNISHMKFEQVKTKEEIEIETAALKEEQFISYENN